MISLIHLNQIQACSNIDMSLSILVFSELGLIDLIIFGYLSHYKEGMFAICSSL